jgi:hypothetical protein
MYTYLSLFCCLPLYQVRSLSRQIADLQEEAAGAQVRGERRAEEMRETWEEEVRQACSLFLDVFEGTSCHGYLASNYRRTEKTTHTISFFL